MYILYPGCRQCFTLGAPTPPREEGGFAISEAAVMSLPRGSLGDGDGNDTDEQP